VKAIYQTNPTEVFRERQLALLREVENRRLARQSRKRSKGHSQSEPRMAGFKGAVAMWGRTSIPFFAS
jgi:hypothetical protein